VTACTIAPSDQRTLAQNVGKSLLALYGQRKSYAPALIKSAMRKQRYPTSWDCWALSVFASQTDFDTYHAAISESCDYAAMRGAMLDAIRPAPANDFGNSTLGDTVADVFDFLT